MRRKEDENRSKEKKREETKIQSKKSEKIGQSTNKIRRKKKVEKDEGKMKRIKRSQQGQLILNIAMRSGIPKNFETKF